MLRTNVMKHGLFSGHISLAVLSTNYAIINSFVLFLSFLPSLKNLVVLGNDHASPDHEGASLEQGTCYLDFSMYVAQNCVSLNPRGLAFGEPVLIRAIVINIT